MKAILVVISALTLGQFALAISGSNYCDPLLLNKKSCETATSESQNTHAN
jgi:hypothetical protein